MTPDLLSAIFTSDKPRCMGCGEPATVHDDPWTLCASCDEALTESLRRSGFPADFTSAPIEEKRT